MKNRIKQLRKSLKLNQTEFGAKIGIKQSTVASYENGNSAPMDSTIKSICREFNVNEEWLRTGEGEMYRRSAEDEIREIVQSHGLNERDYALIRWFASQDDQTRKTIIDAIIDVADNVRRQEQTAAPRNVHDWTDAEMHAALQRQLDAEKRETGEPSTSYSGNSGAATA